MIIAIRRTSTAKYSLKFSWTRRFDKIIQTTGEIQVGEEIGELMFGRCPIQIHFRSCIDLDIIDGKARKTTNHVGKKPSGCNPGREVNL
jgi:hypothetical protein